MTPVTALDGAAQQWTVAARLRERQQHLQQRAVDDAMRIEGDRAMPARSVGGGPFVVALLFAQPDTSAIEMLDRRGAYFDIRTGDTWDLFFPGYSRVEADGPRDREIAFSGFLGEWQFSPRDFDAMRTAVEQRSKRRWEYSGTTDLVVTGGWMDLVGEPTIDWASTVSAALDHARSGSEPMSLGEAIELLSRDIEQQLEDPSFGLRPGVERSGPSDSILEKVMVSAVGGILTGVAKWGLGL